VIRKAAEEDIARLFEIRNNVRENLLNDPASVSVSDVRWFLTNPGIFVWEEGQQVVGFSAADPRNGSIWALFVDPAHEGMGIGQALFQCACGVLKDAGHRRIWLATGSGTRAEAFYRAAGWQASGRKGEEIVFEISW
jgi:GNAT superfamily N-acetyltransferase